MHQLYSSRAQTPVEQRAQRDGSFTRSQLANVLHPTSAKAAFDINDTENTRELINCSLNPLRIETMNFASIHISLRRPRWGRHLCAGGHTIPQAESEESCESMVGETRWARAGVTTGTHADPAKRKR